MENTPLHQTEKPISLGVGALLGAVSSLAVIGLLFLGEQLFAFPFVPFDIFDWMARALPGGLVAFTIRTMVAVIGFLQGLLPIGDTSTAAKIAEQSIAILQLIAGGAFFGIWLAWLSRQRNEQLIRFGQVGGLILLAITLLIESSLSTSQLSAVSSLWLAAVFVAWGWGLAWLLKESSAKRADSPDNGLSRRQFLAVSGAGLSAVALGTWGMARIFGDQPPNQGTVTDTFTDEDPFGASLTSGPAASPPPEELAARPTPPRGTRAELTPTDEFYRIDINTRPPSIDDENWRLKLDGLVDNPVQLSLEDIRALPSQTQILTMQCISNPVGGDLTSSARWTGVRFKDLLATVGLQANATGALIKSVDGFFEYVVMEDIQDERTLLVYEMNGQPLAVKHGFPLRVYIPNRYGMKQPKWIESIELVDERVDGYWVVRGWSREAIPHTVSVVDTVAVDPDLGENGMALSGGIAWAGARGISKVEVQVDASDWEEAELITPPLSSLNWVLWRYAWPYASGRHTLSVRAYDGLGQLQESDPRAPRPNGATGIHSISLSL